MTEPYSGTYVNMAVEKLYIFVLTLFLSVQESVCRCYYYSSYSYCYDYYYYSEYWGTTRIVGTAVGAGISLIVGIIVLIVICRICNARRASQGTVLGGQTITTVSNQQQQQGGYTAPYYPQQPGYPQYQPQYGQPMAGYAGQPMAGYTNYSYNPPAYDQVSQQTKEPAAPSAPQ